MDGRHIRLLTAAMLSICAMVMAKPVGITTGGIKGRVAGYAAASDSLISWNTFLGSGGQTDWGGENIAVDASGNIYVIGYTGISWGSPVSPYVPTGINTFVVKLNKNGSEVWHTYLGVADNDQGILGYGIAVDGGGNVYLTGYTTVIAGAPPKQYPWDRDAFVAKLSPGGVLLWNTIFGGTRNDEGHGIGVDGAGNVYVTGQSTDSWGSPLNAHSTIPPDGFVAKLNTNGALIWNTFCGGFFGGNNGIGIAVDSSGTVLFTGQSNSSFGTPISPYKTMGDAFVVKLNSSGARVWNTFVGGNGIDFARAVAADGSGNILITGNSDATWGSPLVPFAGGHDDGFVAKLNSSGALQWNTFLGGSDWDEGHGIAADGSGNVYVVGLSYATWGSPLDPFAGGSSDGFVAKLASNGALQWHTFLGGSKYDWATGVILDSEGNAYVAGTSATSWGSPLNPFPRNMGDDVFVAKLSLSTSSLSLTLPAGAAASTSTPGSTGELAAGYGSVSVSSGGAPYGTAVFSYRQNGVVVSEAGVPTSPPTRTARFFVDTRSNVNTGRGTITILTGFAAVNPNTAAANLMLKLCASDGRPLAQGTIQLAAGRHMAKFLDQLAPDFVLPAGFITDGLGSLEISSDQPVSVLALRLTTNQRGDLLLTSTPIADLEKAAPSGMLAFPQIADGGGYQTTLILLNTSSASESGVVRFYGDKGLPLAARLTGGSTTDVQFRYAIPAGGFFRAVTDGSPAAANVGWAALIPDAGTSAPVSAAIFGFTQGNALVTESGVPAVTPTTHARIYLDKSGGHDTGLAIANPGSVQIQITPSAYQMDGVTRAGTSQTPVVLDQMGHDARFAGQFVAGLPAGFTGILDISSPSPFVALTLRSLMNSRGDFLMTTFPIADVIQPPPFPLIFPQVADGAGYQTQIIMLSTSGSVSTVVVTCPGDNGSPIAVGRGNL
jgi:hypothetical protein